MPNIVVAYYWTSYGLQRQEELHCFYTSYVCPECHNWDLGYFETRSPSSL